MGEMLAGRYELIDLIDSGGSGAVWRIWDHRLGALRAGKILRQGDADALLRFVRETSRRIEHSHIAAPDGWFGEDGRVMLTMPLVSGGSLDTLVRDVGPLPLGWGIEVLRQLLKALIAVHEVGLVHRDVKPANVLLEPTGQQQPHLRLADFGTAAAVDAPRMTMVGYVIGTPGFMAPEQARGADPDPRQDLYAAGVTATLALTGQHPDADGQPPRVDVPPLTGASGGPLGELLAALLATDPEQRPQTAREALHRLNQIPDCWELGLGADPQNPVEVFDQLGPLPSQFTGEQPDATSVNPWQTPNAQHTPPGPHTPPSPVTTPAPVQVFSDPDPAWTSPNTTYTPQRTPGTQAGHPGPGFEAGPGYEASPPSPYPRGSEHPSFSPEGGRQGSTTPRRPVAAGVWGLLGVGVLLLIGAVVVALL